MVLSILRRLVLSAVDLGRFCASTAANHSSLPFDVKRIDPDFVAVGTYKWLLGPYSMGFLYVAPRWQDAQSIEQNR